MKQLASAQTPITNPKESAEFTPSVGKSDMLFMDSKYEVLPPVQKEEKQITPQSDVSLMKPEAPPSYNYAKTQITPPVDNSSIKPLAPISSNYEILPYYEAKDTHYKQHQKQISSQRQSRMIQKNEMQNLVSLCFLLNLFFLLSNFFG